jgi:hypothetical protein
VLPAGLDTGTLWLRYGCALDSPQTNRKIQDLPTCLCVIPQK